MLLPAQLTRRGTSSAAFLAFKSRPFLDLLAFYGPSPPDYVRAISRTGRGALAMFFTSHESSFRVPSKFSTA
jgi:hypothetical protein